MILYLLQLLIIGMLAGYITGRITKGSGYGLMSDLIIGVVGSILGGFLFRMLGIEAYSLIGTLIMAVIGAIVLLKLIGYFRNKSL